jgi:glycosyltransferase involved in cell wall biosynthesis
MKVLMIAPTPFFADRGCHVRIYEEARALIRQGHQVAICTYHNGRDIDGLETYRIPAIRWYNKLEAGPSLHKLYLDFLLLGLARNVARRWQPDVLHGHLHEGALLAGVLGRLLHRPSLGDLQGSLTGELLAHRFLGGNRLLLSPLRFVERAINRLPDVLVASCDQVATELRTCFAVPDVLLAPDGVDTQTFHPGVSADNLAQLVPTGRPIVVYLGLLNEYQGLSDLLSAVPRVLQQIPEAHFLIMGYPNEETYRQQALELGVGDRVTFTGRVDYQQAPRYLALGSVAVSPKKGSTESNGKLYNYMAMALPTVVFDTPVNREILGEAGVYVPVGDVDGLAAALARLLTDRQMASDLGARLRRRVVEQFSWDYTARQLLSAYAEAVHRRRGQG